MIDWMDQPDAEAYIQRGARTLRMWRKAGIVRARKVHRPGDNRAWWQYGRGSLTLARRDADRRKAEQARNAGPGRGKWLSDNQLFLFE